MKEKPKAFIHTEKREVDPGRWDSNTFKVLHIGRVEITYYSLGVLAAVTVVLLIAAQIVLSIVSGGTNFVPFMIIMGVVAAGFLVGVVNFIIFLVSEVAGGIKINGPRR